MSRPVARVLTLLELLQSGGVRTVSELAERLGVDERTVRRYVQQLVDLDVPVVSVRGRYGGYRLGPGYRMPPLMLSDEEALAVLLALAASRRAETAVYSETAPHAAPYAERPTAAATARETAAAKIRRVLPARSARRLDAVLGSLAFTGPSGGPAAPDPAVLLPLADAVHHHRPVRLEYTAADGRRSERALHPYGVVAHGGRWYLTAVDPSAGEDRLFRLDRVGGVRALPGSFEPPAGADPAERVLTALATVPYRHEVSLRVRGTAEQIRARLPAGLALVTEPPADDGEPEAAESESGATRCAPWCRVELRVERLDWLPAVLASLDLPFAVERPEELRGLVESFAARLVASARRSAPPG